MLLILKLWVVYWLCFLWPYGTRVRDQVLTVKKLSINILILVCCCGATVAYYRLLDPTTQKTHLLFRYLLVVKLDSSQVWYYMFCFCLLRSMYRILKYNFPVPDSLLVQLWRREVDLKSKVKQDLPFLTISHARDVVEGRSPLRLFPG